ncbi:MAG: CoA pyrophosphatase [Actinomycetia bacterium]|nr:CoA pyrophosphatase [Actinomycetes bacterium]
MTTPPSGRGGPQRIPRPRLVEQGGPAPWADLGETERQPDLATVRLSIAPLGGGRPFVGGEGQRTRSAVLIPVYEHDGSVHVVLTRRAWHLRSHPGEVSFPGGRCDPGETPVDTALREAHEELNLDRGSVEVVGELDHLATVSSGSLIVPVVGLLSGRPELVPAPDEVDAAMHVGLAELLAPETWREELWDARQWAGQSGGVQPITFFELEGDTVWGATANMLRELLGRATGTGGYDTYGPGGRPPTHR